MWSVLNWEVNHAISYSDAVSVSGSILTVTTNKKQTTFYVE